MADPLPENTTSTATKIAIVPTVPDPSTPIPSANARYARGDHAHVLSAGPAADLGKLATVDSNGEIVVDFMRAF